MAYYLGGAKAPGSDPAFNAQQDVEPYMVQGLLTFDESNQNFRNSSTVGLNQDNTVADGFLSNIESLGNHGILISFGGFTNSAGVGMSLRDTDLKDPELRWQMQNIAVYDIANQKWYSQQATGDVPSWRYLGCSVVTSAPDGSSHSIYVFGGWGATNAQKNDGNVYVLSLPSFTWIRVTEDFDQRSRHKCHLMGKHHMLVVGGIRPNNDDIQPEDAVGCDTNPKFSQGLGIFSLNDHNWTANYNPTEGASPYLVNPSIFKVIGGNETGGATKQTPTKGFSSDALRILLGISASSSESANSTTTASSPTIAVISVTSSPSPANTTAAKVSQPISGKAIGGTVVGVAGATFLIAAIVYLILRRRRRSRHPSSVLHTPRISRPPLNRYYTELDATPQPQEMLGGSREENLAKQYASYELMSPAEKRLSRLPNTPIVRVNNESEKSSKGSEHIVSPVDGETYIVQPPNAQTRDMLRGSKPFYTEGILSTRHSSWDRRAGW